MGEGIGFGEETTGVIHATVAVVPDVVSTDSCNEYVGGSAQGDDWRASEGYARRGTLSSREDDAPSK